MVFEILVNGTDRAGSVDTSSFSWDTNSRGKPDELSFSIESTENFGLEIAQEVILSIDSVKKFHGQITNCKPSKIGVDRRKWDIQCQDHTEQARQGSLVAEIYKEMTISDILDDIFTRYPHLSSFSTAGVNCEEIIDYSFFGYKSAVDCIKDLADRVGYDFYFDEDRVLHFFLPGEKTAPFEVTESNGKAVKNTVSFEKNLSQVINSVLVEGADYTGNQKTIEPIITADGVEVEYSISGEYAGLEVTVDAVQKTVGAFGLSDPLNYDLLYDFNSRKIIFREDNKPTNGQSIIVSGYQKIPIFIQKTEMSSVLEYGERPKKIKNLSLKTIESAKQYASAEITRYATSQYEGGFSTYDNDLRAGQRITVSDSFLGISKGFSIAKTSTRIYADDTFLTKVTLSNAEVMDTAGILSRMLNRESSTTTASDVLQIFRQVLETVGITEEVEINQNQVEINEPVRVVEATQFTENANIEYVHAPYTQEGFGDNKRLFLHNGSPHSS